MASNQDFRKEKSYPCDVCDVIFYVEENLLQHVKEHSGEKKSCMHCKKKIKRAQNLKYHQQTCVHNADRKKPNMQHGGGGDAVDKGFRLVESALGKFLVLYRKPLNTVNIDDVKLAFGQDLESLLRREAVERVGIKYHLALKVTLYQLTDPATVTDPPPVFTTNATLGLIGSDYEEDLDIAFTDIMEQLDTFENNGSGLGFE